MSELGREPIVSGSGCEGASGSLVCECWPCLMPDDAADPFAHFVDFFFLFIFPN